MSNSINESNVNVVAPLVGAWIEINGKFMNGLYKRVAPLVGAWIEILSYYEVLCKLKGRSSCRSVD